ncbi:antibiotic biosynthesis monooxygenase family protein [Rhodococcus koreensis]
MIVEHALLSVTPDRVAEFESAFGQAQPIISSMPGFRGPQLSRGHERPNVYLLLVEWDEGSTASAAATGRLRCPRAGRACGRRRTWPRSST